MIRDLEELSTVEKEFPIFWENQGLEDYLSELESRVIQEAGFEGEGLKMTEYEEGNDLKARVSSAWGINLGRQMGIPTSDTFDEGVEVVELKRAIQDHYDILSSEGRMPLFVPEEVKNFMDLRISHPADNEYPATLYYHRGSSIPVFVHSYDTLRDHVKSEEYRKLLEETKDWDNHSDASEIIDMIDKASEHRETTLFFIPHIYEGGNKSFYPDHAEFSLVSTPETYFADRYDIFELSGGDSRSLKPNH